MNPLKSIFQKIHNSRPWRVGEFRSAIDQNDVPRVRQMLGEGMDANLVFSQRDGERPLHAAAAWAGPEIIDLLIEAGANSLFGIRWDAFRSFPPSGFATMMGRPDNAEYLRKIEQEHGERLVAADRPVPVFSDAEKFLSERGLGDLVTDSQEKSVVLSSFFFISFVRSGNLGLNKDQRRS